ncbi:MAG TPA: DUF4838 domain-containing protein [Bacteroidales bacterium]|nr:DUF4838 domain-containing protein [Bacteroidales bacterium]HPS72085.1 DUF4838 domain-containing protein [Bacteroidales bacterium]
MKKWIFPLLLLCGFINLSGQSLLFNRATSEHTIVIPAQPSEIELYAASEMQKFLIYSCGATLPIKTEDQTDYTKAIYIGKTKKAEQVLKNRDQIVDDGFIKYSDRTDLYIYGIKGKAVLYGVYDFFEIQLGCHLYTPDALDIQQYGFYVLPSINELKNPSFKYREVLYYYPNHSELYKDWHRLQNREDIQKNWGMFVHTFEKLIPIETYFTEHPEWFSMIHGKRIKDGQLCLSNPIVLEELCKNLKLEIDQNPEALYWSVSNNDNANNCTCDACHRLDSLYGGPTGTLLYFINQVAARFPDKQISTLAYQYTRTPPKRLIQPADNVNIMFCSIECGREMPIETNPKEQSFVSDMIGWKRITNNIFLWDYVVQFRNMMNPFPNLHVLQPNLQFFQKNGVQLMFEQGTGANNKTSWMEIRTYLIAKLLWDVNADVDKIMDEFITGYYEKAAPFIKQYYTLNEQAVIQSGKRLDIYGYPIDGADSYLTPALIRQYDSLFVLAYQTEDKPSIQERIRYLQLSLDFAKIELSMSEISPELSLFTIHKGEKIVKKEMVEFVNRFVNDCKKFGIENLEESGYTPEQFRDNVLNFISKSTTKNLATGKKINLKSTFSEKYNRGGAEALIDGNFGVLNYNQNWLGFHQQDFEAIIDLEKKTTINQISIDFFLFPLSWIFVPEKVEFYISKDGKKWEKVYEELYTNPEILAKASIKKFEKNGIQKEARYIRVKAKAIKTNPEWHRGYGQPCWVFTDEILIQ